MARPGSWAFDGVSWVSWWDFVAFHNHATDLQDQLSGHTHVNITFRLLWRKKKKKKGHAVRAVRNSLTGRIRGQPILKYYLTKDKVMQLKN